LRDALLDSDIEVRLAAVERVRANVAERTAAIRRKRRNRVGVVTIVLLAIGAIAGPWANPGQADLQPYFEHYGEGVIAGEGSPFAIDFENLPDPNGLPASLAPLANPVDSVQAADGTVFIADRTLGVFAISALDGRINRVHEMPGPISAGDGVDPLQAFAVPEYLLIGADQNLYVSGAGIVAKLDRTTAEITRVAGDGLSGAADRVREEGVAALESPLDAAGIGFDGVGNLYVVDRAASSVRRVDAVTGEITTVVGGRLGFAGDGEAAIDAFLADPAGLVVTPDGVMFIADRQNARVRVVRTDGTIDTLAGNGEVEIDGMGGPAAEAAIGTPHDLALDVTGGALWFTDISTGAIRRVDLSSSTVSEMVVVVDPCLGCTPSQAAVAEAPVATGLAMSLDGNSLMVADPVTRRLRSYLVNQPVEVPTTTTTDPTGSTTTDPDGTSGTTIPDDGTDDGSGGGSGGGDGGATTVPESTVPDATVPDPVTPDPVAPDPVAPDPVAPDPVVPGSVEPAPSEPDPATPPSP
jgi:sugar lactone lactonase YvrE